MNEKQIEQVREVVQEFAEKSGVDFYAAFEQVLGMARYHAIDAVPWGKEAICGSGGIQKG